MRPTPHLALMVSMLLALASCSDENANNAPLGPTDMATGGGPDGARPDASPSTEGDMDAGNPGFDGATPDGGGDGLGPEARAADTFMSSAFSDKLSTLYCRAGFRCPGLFGQRSTRFARFADEADCVANLNRLEARVPDLPPGTVVARSALQLDREVILDGIEDGRLVLDPAARDACLGDIDAMLASPETCPRGFLDRGVIDLVWACRDAFVGTVPQGGTCLRHEECEGNDRRTLEGAICDTSGDSCSGTCEPALSAGEACSEMCTEGQYCDFNTSTCQQATASLGETCMGRQTSECGVGRYCDRAQSDEGQQIWGRCAALESRAEGEPCEADRHCQTGLVCDQRSAPPFGTCTLPSEVVLGVEGDACGLERGCKPSLVCALSGPGAEGGSCALPGDDGTRCYREEECADEKTCVGDRPDASSEGSCEAPRADGEPCTSGLDCASNACQNNSCVLAPAAVCEL